MFSFFGKNRLSIESFEKIVTSINAEYETMQHISGDELRERARQLADTLHAGLEPFNISLQKLQQRIETDTTLDILQLHRLYDEMEAKEKEKFEKSEILLKQYLPTAYAILKTTCRLFSLREALRVTVTDFDRLLAQERDYVTIEEDIAFFHTTWMAGGKEIIWNMIPYDGQLLTGVILQYGEIAEMNNGEGKTLAAVFPLFLNAIAGRKVHMCTANPFLSLRDCQWMRPLLEFHGISVSEIDQTEPNSDERRKAYAADIVYGTANEFGFDYLRDNMVLETEEIVQSKLDFAIIDEIDSILIDDARTPLIISGPLQKRDFILDQFNVLQPVALALVEAQTEILERYFNKAKSLAASGNLGDAAAYLYKVKRGNPKFSSLHQFLNTTPHALRHLNKYEKIVQRDNLEEEIDKHLYFVTEPHSVELTEPGKQFIANISEDPNFWTIPDIDKEMTTIEQQGYSVMNEIALKRKIIDGFEFIMERSQILHQLIKAYIIYQIDVDYIVSHGRVLIVDSNTGRALRGRSYSNGLQQAIETKEGVQISGLTEEYATITLQSFFLKYRKLGGMSATAKMDEREYKNIYNKRVLEIAPHKQVTRVDKQDLVYMSKREKLNAVIQEIRTLVRSNRPVLVGTTTVEDSELISKYLAANHIAHQLLNAKQDEEEALIISRAGIPRTVTVAALMAGRGTDIKLTRESIEAGGLAVIGFERHETRRLDHQLKGRAGRQGDPGSSQFFVSLEDDLMRRFGSDAIASLMEKLGYKEGDVIQHSMITNSIVRAQKKVEEHQLGVRSRLYEYDNSLNLAREGIYQERNHALSGYRVQFDVRLMYDDVSQWVVSTCNKTYERFAIQVIDTFNYKTKISEQEFHQMDEKSLTDRLSIEAYENYMHIFRNLAEIAFPAMKNIRITQGAHIENVVIPFAGRLVGIQVLTKLDSAIETKGVSAIRKFEAHVIISTIDKHWKAFLKRYHVIKEDISLMSSIQKGDPLVLFKKDISEYYNELLTEIHFEIVNNLCFMRIPVADKQEATTPEEENLPENDSPKDLADGEDTSPEPEDDGYTISNIATPHGVLYKIIAKDKNGDITWSFYHVDADNHKTLPEQEEREFNPVKRGDLIISGYGEEVPLEAQMVLKARYGITDIN